MTATPVDCLLLRHDAPRRLLYQRWQGEHNMHQFRHAAHHVHALLRQYAVESWVADLNGLPNLSLEDQIWLGAQLLPALAPLISLRRLALVLSPNVYNQLAVETLLEQAQRYLRLDVQFFADAASALDWVRVQPAARPGASCAA